MVPKHARVICIQMSVCFSIIMSSMRYELIKTEAVNKMSFSQTESVNLRGTRSS